VWFPNRTYSGWVSLTMVNYENNSHCEAISIETKTHYPRWRGL